MGPDHAMSGMDPSPACTACQVIPRLTRQHRGDHFLARCGPQEEPEDQDLDVVEMGEPGEVPFRFSLPRGQMAPVPEEDDDEDASSSGGPTLSSAR